MTILIPGKALVLCHPRTGSNALRQAAERAGYKVFRNHLSPPELLTNSKEFRKLWTGEEAVYCTIRNPVSILRSWYAHTHKEEGRGPNVPTFRDFILSFSNPTCVRDGTLFYLARYVTANGGIIRTENLQYDWLLMLKSIGEDTHGKELDYVNNRKSPLPNVTAGVMYDIWRRFSFDMVRYGYCGPGPEFVPV